MRKYIYFLLFMLSYSFVYTQTVTTQYGSVEGHMNDNVYEFLGIPFASPPVGDLRWKPTMPHDNWLEPFVADSFPPKCPQKKYDIGDDSTFTLLGEEDCLYLNVWSPDLDANLPVMVFIHGGGNQQGSTSEIGGGTEIYHGKNLALRGNVVVVTIQYRLGVLGYLIHPGLEAENEENLAGNYGVMDQIFALHWVQNNIEAFGGDPTLVTIFGESGGGVNVGNLMTSQEASGLFHRAIIQSAIPVLGNYDTIKNEGINFVNEYFSSGSDSLKIAQMREIDPDSITIKMSSPLEGGIVQMNWPPVVDGYIFPDNPETIFQSGNYNRVPLIIGTNADEMLPQIPMSIYPFMVNFLLNTLLPPEYLDTALALYPPGSVGEPSEASRQAYAGILTDGQFTATARRTAQCISMNQSEPVWRYFLSHTHSESIPIIGDYGAYHGIDLFYIFNNWENSPLAIGPWFTDQDDSVQHNMLSYWTNFAYTGNPNGEHLVEWPQYNADLDCYLEIKATPDGSQCGLRTAKSDLWDVAAGFEGCTNTYDIMVDVFPENSGTVTGQGSYTFGESVTLEANPADGYVFYCWTENDEIVSFDTVLNFDADGDRQLSANFEIENNIESTTLNELVIYPNPASGWLRINLGNSVSNNVNLKVYNLIGQLAIQKDYQVESIENSTLEVSVKGLEYGAYNIVIQTDENVHTRKVIVSNK